jgi:DNA-binding response OmpR family regulator
LNGTVSASESAPVDGASSVPRILIVEDNPHYATTLRTNLEIEGFSVVVAGSVVEGLARLRDGLPDLVLLDVMLPGESGYDFLRTVRTQGSEVPILLLTARRDEEDKLRGFGLGADDFVAKPVTFQELIARIRAVLRRTSRAFEHSGPNWLRFGDVEVDPPTRTVTRQGKVVNLRPKEFDLLLALMRQHDRVVSREELLRDVWGYRTGVFSRTVDTHMAVLRQKLEAVPLNPRYLITVRAAGYMLRWRGDGAETD